MQGKFQDKFQTVVSSSLALIVGLGLSIALNLPKTKAVPLNESQLNGITLNGVRFNTNLQNGNEVMAVQGGDRFEKLDLNDGQLALHIGQLLR